MKLSWFPVVSAALAAGCLTCTACGSPGKALQASSAGSPQVASAAWKPGSVDNHVLEAGTKNMATGNGYQRIATRAKDPRPLSARELSGVFPHSPIQLSPDCADAVTGQALKTVLTARTCSQVLRLITSPPQNGGGHATALIDIFNLTNGTAVYDAGRLLGQYPVDENVLPPGTTHVPNRAPGGFLRSWPGTPASNMAGASGNSAVVDGFGHFLVVIWARGETNSLMGNDGVAALLDTAMNKFTWNRQLAA